MLHIETNLAGVIRQVQRLQQNIQPAINRCMIPERWLQPMRMTAAAAIRAIPPKPDEQKYIEPFIATVQAAVIENGMSFTMSKPPLEYPFAKSGQGGLGLLEGMEYQEARDWILKWVSTPPEEGGKDWTRRDPAPGAPNAEEDVASVIAYIMLSPEYRNIRDENGTTARERLMPHIQDFILRQMAGGLAVETVDLWLRSALIAWREMIKVHWPQVLKQELRAMKDQL